MSEPWQGASAGQADARHPLRTGLEPKVPAVPPTMADLRVRWVIALARRREAIRKGDLDAALVEQRRIDIILDLWPAVATTVLSTNA